MRTKPLVDRPRLLPGHLPEVPGGLGIIEQLWHTAAALAKRVGKAFQHIKADRPASVARVREAQFQALKLLRTDSGDMKLAWSAIADPADATAATIGMLKICGDKLDMPLIDSVVALFRRLVAKEAANRAVRQQQSWRSWIQKAMQHGAGKAHRWTNQPNSPQVDLIVQPGQSIQDSTLTTSPKTVVQVYRDHQPIDIGNMVG